MNAIGQLLAEVARLGGELVVVDDRLKLRPPGVLPLDLKTTIRERAVEIKAALQAGQSEPRATWPRDVRANSRHPLIPPEVRAKLEAIEADARAKGWPPELLWNAGFWDSPRGLAAILNPGDEIAEVTADCIAVLKTKRDLVRFRRHVA